MTQIGTTGHVYRIDLADLLGFQVNDAVSFYEVGNEDAALGAGIIHTITEGVDYATVEINAGLGDMLAPYVMTFSTTYADTVTRQRRFMFVQADKEWR